MTHNLGELLRSVPILVRAYGRWASFLYLVLATTLSSRVLLLAVLLLVLWIRRHSV